MGIIINELLTNIMKHAFAGVSNCRISVSAKLTGRTVSLTVSDNGVGIPESIDFKNSTGFGMQLISLLADQLDGNVKIERGEGNHVYS